MMGKSTVRFARAEYFHVDKQLVARKHVSYFSGGRRLSGENMSTRWLIYVIERIPERAEDELSSVCACVCHDQGWINERVVRERVT